MKKLLIIVLLFLSVCSLPSYAIKNFSQQEIEKLKILAESDAKIAKKLGFLFLRGTGVQKNILMGLEYLEKAAALGDKQILNFLIKSYSKKSSQFYNPKKLKLLLALRDQESGSILKSLPRDKNHFLGWKNESIDANQITTTGSGFAINGKGIFLTNDHVVGDCRKVIIGYNGYTSFARVIKKNKKYDLAVLKVSGSTPYYLSFSRHAGIIGQEVLAAGFPQQMFKLSEGIIASIIKERFLLPGLEWIQISASVSSGNSGGPVIDKNGRLLGVATLKGASGVVSLGDGGEMVRGDDYDFAVSNSTMKRFLDKSKIRYKVSDKQSTKTLNTIKLAEFLGKTSCIVLCYGR